MDFRGIHSLNLEASRQRVIRGKGYQDQSTIWITPTRGRLLSRVVTSWMGLIRPMNQKFAGPFFIENMEVGEAYNKAVEMILEHPELKNWKYMLTVEEDNLPPPDGILKLYENMHKYDCIGGLYWTKGEGGQPMIYGDPKEMPKSFRPQIPEVDTIQPACGLGMGFNLFKISMFKKLPKPWFKTVQENGKAFTQDLYFYDKAGTEGFKFACDTRVKVGHIDDNGMIW